MQCQVKFLSTLSLRRATHLTDNLGTRFCISIHALLAESDRGIFTAFCVDCLFLSTLSLRRATDQTILKVYGYGISIHALLAESDCQGQTGSAGYLHFYPRSPCGERRSWTHWPINRRLFLSTLSLRRATVCQVLFLLEFKFLSTLSLRRATETFC